MWGSTPSCTTQETGERDETDTKTKGARGSVTQRVENRPFKSEVGGSSPPGPTGFYTGRRDKSPVDLLGCEEVLHLPEPQTPLRLQPEPSEDRWVAELLPRVLPQAVPGVLPSQP